MLYNDEDTINGGYMLYTPPQKQHKQGEISMQLLSIIALAEEAAGTAAEATTATGTTSSMSMIASFLPFIIIIVLLYFMMIRPQRKRDKELKEMIAAMKVGDKVVTIGGICGKISKIKDDFVVIQTGNIGTPDECSYIKMERSAIKEVNGTKQN